MPNEQSERHSGILKETKQRNRKLNPKACYAYAGSKLKTKEGIPDLEDENGNQKTLDTNKANLPNKLFCSVSQ